MYENPIRMPKPVATVYDHEKDIRLSLQLNRWILQPLGVWPKSAEISSAERCMYILVNIICTGLIGFLFVPTIIYVTHEIEDTYNTVKFSGPLGFFIMAVIKYSSLIFRESDIRSCIERIASDWMNTRYHGDRVIMIKNAKFGRRLIVICAIFMYGSATFYYLILPFGKGMITEDDSNLTYRPLVYPFPRVIIDARHSPITEILFWTQCLSGFIAHSISTGVCSLAAVFAMHAYGRMEILMQWIEHLVDGREDLYSSVDDRLAMIVHHQVEILRFIALIDKILREMSFVEVVGSSLSLCILGYCIITEWENKDTAAYITYFVLLISITFNIFIFCYIGELVAEQCKRMGEVSYMIDWHRLPERKSLALVLIIAMSNSSIKLTAGNLFKLSLDTFGDVIRRSVAYLNMLRTLTS